MIRLMARWPAHPAALSMAVALALSLHAGSGAAQTAAPAAATSKAAPAATLKAGTPVRLMMVPLPSTRQQMDINMSMRMTMALVLPPDAPAKARDIAAQVQKTMPLTMTAAMRQDMQTAAKTADGSYPLEAQVTTLKSEMRNAQGQTQPLPASPPIVLKATIREDRIDAIEASIPNGTPEQEKMFSKEAQEKLFNQTFDWVRKFSDVTLKVGESIEMPLELAIPMAPADVKSQLMAKYTLVSVKQGVALFDVGVRMEMNFAVPMPAASAASGAEPAEAASAPAPVSTNAAMTGSGSGKVAMRLADRLMLSSTMKMRMGMDLEPQPGQKMRMDMDINMSSAGKTLPAAKKAPASPAKPATKG